MTRIQANLALLLAAAIWGGGFVAQSTAMNHVGAHWFNALRFGLATLALLPFAWIETRRATKKLTPKQIGSFILIGFFLFLAQTAQQFGLKTTTVTNASFLTGLYVVIVPILSVVLLKYRPHWVVWPASMMSLTGIFLLNGATLTTISPGDSLTILCALLFAIQILLTGRVMHAIPRPLTLAAAQSAVTTVLCTGAASAMEPITFSGISGAMPQILFGGLFSSGLAFSLQIIGQRYTSSSQAAIFMSSEALFGAMFGAILLHETLPVIGYLGCGLLFLAMLAVEIVPEWHRSARKMA